MDSACPAEARVKENSGEDERLELQVEDIANAQGTRNNVDGTEDREDASLYTLTHFNGVSLNGQSTSTVSSDESHESNTKQGVVLLAKHERLPKLGENLYQVLSLTPMLDSKDIYLVEAKTEPSRSEMQPQQNIDLISSASETYEPGTLSSMSSIILVINETNTSNINGHALSESRNVIPLASLSLSSADTARVTSSSRETSVFPLQSSTSVSLLGTKTSLLLPPQNTRGPPPPPPPAVKKGPPPPPPPAVKKGPPPPPPPAVKKGPPPLPSASGGASRPPASSSATRVPLKPFHWIKIPKAAPGSLWAKARKLDESLLCPAINTSELECLFAASIPITRSLTRAKLKKIHLIDIQRAKNCEIMLTKFKMPLSDVSSAILSLDCSILNIDQVENLLKFCPTKEEMDLLKDYSGEKEMLGKCEQFFMEMMKVPRVKSKLQAFSFRLHFLTQVNDLRRSLNIMNNASKEVRESIKLLHIMKTILYLGNALNEGTSRGSAAGFKLDSLLKLGDLRARDNKMTLMHYLCKLLSDKLPELLDFDKELTHLEDASKFQLKFLDEEMQAVCKSLEKLKEELQASETDGCVSQNFQKNLEIFLDMAEDELGSLRSLYSEVVLNVEAVPPYFGEVAAICPFEQVISKLLDFVRMFKKAYDENCKLVEK